MEITVNMKIVNAGSLIAVGDVTLEGCINMHQVKVISAGDGGWMVSLPRIRGSSGAWHDTVVLSDEQLEELRERVCDALRETLSLENPFEVILQEGNSDNCIAFVKLKHKKTGIELRDIQVRDSRNGLFVSFPKQRMTNGTFANLVDLPTNVKTLVEQDILSQAQGIERKRGVRRNVR